MNHPKPVYATKRGLFAGEFRFLQHPDDCPDGEWRFFKSTSGPTPAYWWIIMNEPR